MIVCVEAGSFGFAVGTDVSTKGSCCSACSLSNADDDDDDEEGVEVVGVVAFPHDQKRSINVFPFCESVVEDDGDKELASFDGAFCSCTVEGC